MKFSLMTAGVPDILSRIIEQKRADLRRLLSLRPELERQAEVGVEARRDFKAALTNSPPAIIAEIKKASPSKGVLVRDYQPRAIARAYAEGGAAALSVLTDESFFQGSLADLTGARAEVTLPVLRKDFTIDEFHVVEAAAHGADAVLLIAAVLDTTRLAALRRVAGTYRMTAIVEVHDERELDSALESGAEIIGVNNRNLHTFEVSLETSLRLASRIPERVVRVSESGIHSAGDVRRLRDAGYEAFLVGEHLMTSGNPAETLRALRS